MYLVFLTYLPQRFVAKYPNELAMNGFLLIAMPLFSLAGTFLCGVILDRSKKSPFLLIRDAFFGMVFLCIILIFAKKDIMFLAIALLMLTCSGILQGSIFATIPYLSDSPIIHAYANGAITQMGNIGTTLGAPIFNLLLLKFNWDVAFLLPICSSFLGLWLIFLFSKN